MKPSNSECISIYPALFVQVPFSCDQPYFYLVREFKEGWARSWRRCYPYCYIVFFFSVALEAQFCSGCIVVGLQCIQLVNLPWLLWGLARYLTAESFAAWLMESLLQTHPSPLTLICLSCSCSLGLTLYLGSQHGSLQILLYWVPLVRPLKCSCFFTLLTALLGQDNCALPVCHIPVFFWAFLSLIAYDYSWNLGRVQGDICSLGLAVNS